MPHDIIMALSDTVGELASFYVYNLTVVYHQHIPWPFPNHPIFLLYTLDIAGLSFCHLGLAHLFSLEALPFCHVIVAIPLVVLHFIYSQIFYAGFYAHLCHQYVCMWSVQFHIS